jgi:hypothetical protein
MRRRKKKSELPDQAERSKRGAAGKANDTKGRSRVFKDRLREKKKEGFDAPDDN